jgi:hypothetical protein
LCDLFYSRLHIEEIGLCKLPSPLGILTIAIFDNEIESL